MNEQICGATRKEVFDYVASEYGTQPEHPWMDLPEYAVLRHPGGKWYGVVMYVRGDRLGIGGEDFHDILVFKCPPELHPALLARKGFLPAYHMNKLNWLAVLLDVGVLGSDVHHGRDGLAALAHGVALEELAHLVEEHDRGALGHVGLRLGEEDHRKGAERSHGHEERLVEGVASADVARRFEQGLVSGDEVGD